ncbi:SLC13 family permease [Nocardia sp. NPDC056100]|uniref:SLC13 family permease n=1 Tax=Nocardia sp. NPDC056100 TaxID=3345712 RepID=UPI0035DE8515
MSQATQCLIVLGVVIALFLWNRLPVEIVALGSALLVYALGLIDSDQVFAGFGDPVVVFIAAMFVVSGALEASGITGWAGRRIVALSGGRQRRALVLAMLVSAALAALLTQNGAVAALLPVTVSLAITLGARPSKFLVPLAYAAHAGTLLVLTGTPVNVLVNEAAEAAGVPKFRFFDFAVAGIPLVAGTIALALLLERLLPDRDPETLPADLSEHARTLVYDYQLTGGAALLRVRGDSPLVGLPADTLIDHKPPGVFPVTVLTADEQTRGQDPVERGDLLVVRGAPDAVNSFARQQHLERRTAPDDDQLIPLLLNAETGLLEVVVSPRSRLVGQRVFPGMSSDVGDVVVLGVRRDGRDRESGNIRMAAGDTLLLHGSWDALARKADRRADVLSVESPGALRSQLVPPGPRAWRALGVVAVMVLLMATGVVPAAVAVLLAACAMVVLRVLDPGGAYRSISWTTVVLIGGMFPLSIAMQHSGAADQVAHTVVSAAGGNGILLLLGLFVITALLGQFISNTATALVIVPVAVSAAADAGISLRPVLMCVAIAAAAAVLTPIATPANLMILGPGGYRFGDYWRFGLPVLALYLVVALGIVPLIWSF